MSQAVSVLSVLSGVSKAGGRSEAASAKRNLAGLLLAAALSALLVAADQLIEAWVDGHVLATWVAMWVVAFAAIAFVAPPLRRLAAWSAAAIVSALRAAEERRLEARLWELAHRDPRIMEELRAAWERNRA